MPKSLERCVKKVCAEGKSKSSAYAICSSSTGWKKAQGGGWKNTRTGKNSVVNEKNWDHRGSTGFFCK
jgi:hypothetical protein